MAVCVSGCERACVCVHVFVLHPWSSFCMHCVLKYSGSPGAVFLFRVLQNFPY